MQQIVWTITFPQPPKLERHCTRCGKSLFQSSGAFRINANKKLLDVWLVYRCETCAGSYNLPIYERVAPGWLAARGDEYARLLANDAALAAQYAGDSALLKRRGLAPVWGGVFSVDGPIPAGEECEITLSCPAGVRLRLDKLLAQKLGLPREAIKTLCKAGAIAVPGSEKAYRQAVGNGTVIIVKSL